MVELYMPKFKCVLSTSISLKMNDVFSEKAMMELKLKVVSHLYIAGDLDDWKMVTIDANSIGRLIRFLKGQMFL